MTLYAKPGVAPTCLALQDQWGVDVNLLFFLAFLASHGRCLNVAEVRQIDDFIRPWREHVVWPLRSVRRALKNGVAPVSAGISGKLRDAIKREELHAERQQQQALEQRFPPETTGLAANPDSALHANLDAYQELIGKPTGAIPVLPWGDFLAATLQVST